MGGITLAEPLDDRSVGSAVVERTAPAGHRAVRMSRTGGTMSTLRAAGSAALWWQG